MIETYTHKPTPIFHTIETEVVKPKTRFYGCEDEIDKFDDKHAAEVKYTKKFPSFTYQKQDGTIPNGFEVVSHPATLEYHMNGSAKWEERLSYLKELGGKSNTTTTCGLHIHVNKSCMSSSHQLRFGIFINRFKFQMEKLARRSECDYAKFVNVGGWTPSSSIYDYKHIRNNRGSRRWGNNDRKRAVNYKNRETIEVRIFKGTLKANTLKASIQLVDAIIEYTKSHKVDIICSTKMTNTWNDFCNLVQRKNYSFLINYMTKLSLFTPSEVVTISEPIKRRPSTDNRKKSTKLVAYELWLDGRRDPNTIYDGLIGQGRNTTIEKINLWISYWSLNNGKCLPLSIKRSLVCA